MKRTILAVLAALAIPTVAMAAPWLICDPQVGVTYYDVTGSAAVTSPVTAQPDGSLRVDLAAVPPGTFAVSVRACRADATWGNLCSDPTAFSSVRPGAPTAPLNLRVSP